VRASGYPLCQKQLDWTLTTRSEIQCNGRNYPDSGERPVNKIEMTDDDNKNFNQD
jgi:hypothetical protein